MDNLDYAKLHDKVSDTRERVVGLEKDMGYVKDDVGEIKTMMEKQQEARTIAGAARHKERTNRLWTWIAIMGSWVFALIGIILKR